MYSGFLIIFAGFKKFKKHVLSKYGAVMVLTASALMCKHAGCCEVNPLKQSARLQLAKTITL